MGPDFLQQYASGSLAYCEVMLWPEALAAEALDSGFYYGRTLPLGFRYPGGADESLGGGPQGGFAKLTHMGKGEREVLEGPRGTGGSSLTLMLLFPAP